MPGVSRVSGKRGAKQSTSISTRAAIIAAMCGIAEMGPIGGANALGELDGLVPIQSFGEFQAIYGGPTTNSRDLWTNVRCFFQEAGDSSGAQLFISRIVHTTTLGDPTTKTSAAGSLTLNTASFAPTSAYSQAANAGPYQLTSGDTLVVQIDALSLGTATFTATQAYQESIAGPYVITNGMTLTVSVDGGGVQTITFLTGEFTPGAATAAEVAAVVSAKLAGVLVSVESGKVRIKSERFGTSSTINVTGGTANAVLTIPTGTGGTGTGTGNVANIKAVTVAEVKTVVEAAAPGSTVTDVGGAPRITSNTDGSSSIVHVQLASTADDEMGFDNVSHTGLAGSPQATLVLTGRWDGTYIHEFTTKVVAARSGDTSRRDIQLLRNGVKVEEWLDWKLVSTDARHLVNLINNGGGGQKASKYVTAEYVGTLDAPNNLPASITSGAFTGGDDGLSGLVDSDFSGGTSDNGRTGLRVFDVLDRLDEVAAPGRATASFQNSLVTFTDSFQEGHTFGILGSPAGYSVAQMRQHQTSTAALKGLSETCRIAYPRIQVENPAKSLFGSEDLIVVPAEGAIMGMHARLTASKVGGAFESPAGVEGGFLRSARGIETREAEDKNKRGLLQDDNVAVIRSQRGRPVYVDGASTLNREGVFPSCGQSRGVILVINDVIDALEPLREKNINEALFSRIKNAIEVYLGRLADEGCFRTRVHKEAYFADFGKAQNTAETVEAEEINGVIGLNTSPPATYINFTVVPFQGFANDLAAAA